MEIQELSLRFYKLECTDPMTSWKVLYFCENCLNDASHLKRDWFIKISETNNMECCYSGHNRIKRKIKRESKK